MRSSCGWNLQIKTIEHDIYIWCDYLRRPLTAKGAIVRAAIDAAILKLSINAAIQGFSGHPILPIGSRCKICAILRWIGVDNQLAELLNCAVWMGPSGRTAQPEPATSDHSSIMGACQYFLTKTLEPIEIHSHMHTVVDSPQSLSSTSFLPRTSYVKGRCAVQCDEASLSPSLCIMQHISTGTVLVVTDRRALSHFTGLD